MYGLSYHLAIEQLKLLDPDYRVVVIHPNYVQQHLILSALLDDEACIYVRFDGKNLAVPQLDAQFAAALSTHEGAAPARVRQIVLDECDCALAGEFEVFIRRLLDTFSGGRVVIFTRYPPYELLENADLRDVTVFVPVDEEMMMWDYAHRTTDKKVLLEVRALGTGRVLRDGRSVDNWDGLLPRSLFFYLVDRGMTTRNEIFETFWPTLSVREATNVFHVTKRKISEVLGVDLTVYWSGFYHISPDIELSYDVVRFSELCQDSAIASLDEATSLLSCAISLYRDDFLTALEMSWVADRRRELRQAYGDALIGLAKAREQQHALPEALGLYLRAATTNPHREDVALSAMKLYQDMDMPSAALEVYERLKNELQQTLGVDPANHLQELAGTLERVVVNGH
ncbi:MAG: bacterial transcriptional activator domain-containing protein [Anaerolineae bacterium]|nr:bacterial transcriptional activator domain-containing protein [Anaerolineae bacterium]